MRRDLLLREGACGVADQDLFFAEDHGVRRYQGSSVPS